MLFKDFYDTFARWLPEEEKGEWSRKKTSMNLPVQFPTRRGGGNKLYIDRIAWRADAEKSLAV